MKQYKIWVKQPATFGAGAYEGFSFNSIIYTDKNDCDNEVKRLRNEIDYYQHDLPKTSRTKVKTKLFKPNMDVK